MREIDGEQKNADELELSPEEAESLNYVRRTMLTKIQALQSRIQSLEKGRPCPTRRYIRGVYKIEESKMRCSFCGACGRHYSDSCPRIRDSVRRKLLLKKQRRCKICLEIGCIADPTCTKYWNRCFHCGRMGHHSAICDWPDKAQEIEDEIRESLRELSAAKKKVSTILNVWESRTTFESLPGPNLHRGRSIAERDFKTVSDYHCVVNSI
uniref:CCHC-type domain-containing protein n=1 Tax=Haemonchus contortus TaxID=6289 RepID=A0A7I4XWC3_HAECO